MESINQSRICLPSLRKPWDLFYPTDFWDMREIKEIELGFFRDWKLPKSDLSRKNTPDWFIVYSFFIIIQISLTTIGYGDIKPETTSGKILICCFAIFGTCFLAMPAVRLKSFLRLPYHLTFS